MSNTPDRPTWIHAHPLSHLQAAALLEAYHELMTSYHTKPRKVFATSIIKMGGGEN